MMPLRIELRGQPRILQDQKTVKLRTNLQLLLLARLIAHHPQPLERAETAGLLWPDASDANRSTYLRRALMELRQVGFDIQSQGSKIKLNPDEVECDLWEFLDESSTEGSLPTDEEILLEINHPIASEVKSVWRKRIHALHDYHSDTSWSAPERLRLWLAEKMIEEQPEAVLATLATHGAEMTYKKPTQGLIDLFQAVLSRVPEPTPHKVKILLFASQVAMHLTHFQLARKMLDEVVRTSKELGLVQEETQAYGGLANLSAEFHDFDEAIEYGEMAVARAMSINNARSASGTLINLGHIYGQRLQFGEAVQRFLLARDQARSIQFEGQVKVALASLAYYWGVLGCDIDPALFEGLRREPSLGYMQFIDSYLHFGMAMGRGDGLEAAINAQEELEVTAEEGMERIFYVALDHCAIAMATLNEQDKSAAILRASSQYRRNFRQGRSPLEKYVIRKHIAPPYFGGEVERLFSRLRVDDPPMLAREIIEIMKQK